MVDFVVVLVVVLVYVVYMEYWVWKYLGFED